MIDFVVKIYIYICTDKEIESFANLTKDQYNKCDLF